MRVDAQVARIIYNMFGVAFKSHARHLLFAPTFAVGFETAVASNAVFNPGSHFKGNTFGRRVLDYLHLRNLRIFEVDGQILYGAVSRLFDDKRNHAAVEDKVRAVAFDGEITPLVEVQTNRLRLSLVVVRDV